MEGNRPEYQSVACRTKPFIIMTKYRFSTLIMLLALAAGCLLAAIEGRQDSA